MSTITHCLYTLSFYLDGDRKKDGSHINMQVSSLPYSMTSPSSGEGIFISMTHIAFSLSFYRLNISAIGDLQQRVFSSIMLSFMPVRGKLQRYIRRFS